MTRRVFGLSIGILVFLYCSVRPSRLSVASTNTCGVCETSGTSATSGTQPCPDCTAPLVTTGTQCLPAPQPACGSMQMQEFPEVSFVGPTDTTATGTVAITLTAAEGTVTFGTTTYSAVLYNGSYIPPVWRANPGQSLAVTLQNNLPAEMPQIGTAGPNWTNLHYHGFNVSPQGNSDNIFIEVDSGGAPEQYLVNIPTTHPEGMFWFHPHPHGISEPQVLGGMSGVAIVNGLLENYYSTFAGVTEKVFLLKDFLTGQNPATDTATPVLPLPQGQSLLKSVNGQACPGTISIEQNETQLWDFGNVGADAFFNLQVTDSTGTAIPWNVIAIDGNPMPGQARTDPTLDLPAGRRMQVLAQFPQPGLYPLKHLPVDTGTVGDCNAGVLLGYVNVTASERQPGPSPINAAATRSPQRPNLQALQNAALPTPFTVVFGEDAAGANFCINGNVYCPTRVDKRSVAGTTERWVIQNATDEAHVFHIHQLDYLIEVPAGGTPNPPTYATYQDTVTIPPRTSVDQPGQVTILMQFDPVTVGNFVYHCHILGHEDLGMMANICVAEDDSTPCPALTLGPQMSKGHGHGSHR